MCYLQSIWRRLELPAAVAACWLAASGSALAAEAAEKKGGGSWAPCYGLVLLGIGLGVLGVCLTSRRRDRDKPEMYAKSKLVGDE